MAEDGESKDQPLGVILIENLSKALLANTEAQTRSAAASAALVAEIKLLREDIEGIGGFTGEVLGHLTTYLRILDHVAMSSVDRPPKWKDVQEILQEIKDEIQQAEAEEGEEEEEEDDEGGSAPPPPPRSELFPKRGKSG